MTLRTTNMAKNRRKLRVCFLTLYNFAKVQPVSLANLCLGSSIYHSELNSSVEMYFPSFDNEKEPSTYIAEQLLALQPDIVVMGCYVWNETACQDITKFIKQINPNICVWMGGVNVLYSSEGFSELYGGVDVFIRGEGEDVITKLVELSLEGSDRPDFLAKATQLFGVSDHNSFDNKTSERLVVDLEATFSPYLAYDMPMSLFDYIGGDYTYIFMETSRGCVYSCAFCSFDSQKLGFRHYPLERISKEIRVFCEHNVEQIFFCDAIFGGKKNNAKKLLKMLEENRPTYLSEGVLHETFLYAYFRPELLDAEFCFLLSTSKFSMVQLGIQTVNPSVDGCMRRNNISKIEQNMPILRLNKVPFQIDMIVGFPGDTLSGFADSLQFVIEVCRPSNFRAYTLAINPGTPLENLVHSKGNAWLRYHPVNRKVISTYSFDENDMNEMLSIGDVFVGLYDYLVDAKADDSKFSIQYFSDFYQFLKYKETKIFEEILQSHQYNDKSSLFSPMIRKFDQSMDCSIDSRRVIYGKNYTRGFANEFSD
ncbi:B12-binding domain-containing radical SAM protein [Vibrio bivalvicida]|uniref:Radical SAM protein n=1 Tax=Vibrio bivalvicida TaxID=1276888 RepID=A0ABV4MIK0_9VIBR